MARRSRVTEVVTAPLLMELLRDEVPLEKSCEKAGAKILMPVTEAPGQGKFFGFQVGGGPPLACWQQTGPRT